MRTPPTPAGSKTAKPHGMRNAILLGISAAVFAVSAWIFFNRQYVIDEIRLSRYSPSAQIQAIANATTMQGEGRRYFFASQPEINEATAFNKNCQDHGEKTIVLGCYRYPNIYVKDITDKRLPGVEEVTSAHEMLHAAYDRLGSDERQEVDRLIRAELGKITDPRLIDLAKLYNTTEPGELVNEMHSIIGTEVKDIAPELERYYARYFADRQKVIALSQGYEKVFSDLKAQQSRLSAELDKLNEEISRRSEQLNRDIEQLNLDVAAFNKRANGGEFSSRSEFQEERNRLAARQSALSAERAAINRLINRFNEIRQELAALNLQAESLNRSLDSTPQEVPSSNL